MVRRGSERFSGTARSYPLPGVTMIGSCPPFTIVVEPVKMPPELLGSCLKTPELLNDPSFQRATARCASGRKVAGDQVPVDGAAHP